MSQECPDYDRLRRFLTRELSSAEYTGLERHLDECSLCDDTLLNLERDTAILRGPGPVADLSTSDHSALLNRLREIPLAAQEADPAGASPQLIGTTLREYRLLEEIGRGGMGTVFRAEHQSLGKQVAVKVLPAGASQDQLLAARFRREMKAVGRLEHPNIVRALDAGQEADTLYLAMELVDGPDLSQLVKRVGPPSIADASEIVLHAAEALQAAHEAGLVHRDIKPSNLMLDRDGRVRLLDLGLALLHEDNHPDATGESPTTTGVIMGSVDYMAPEQAMDTHSVDIRADIYSLGCTFYFLLTGQAPFRRSNDKSPMQALMRHANDPIPNVRQLRPDVPDALAELVHKMMAKSADERPQLPQEITETIRRFSSDSDTHSLRASFQAGSNHCDDIALTETVSALPVECPIHSETTRISDGLVSAVAETSSGGRIRNRIMTVCAAFGALGLLFALGVIFQIATDRGDVVIRVGDDIDEEVSVSIMRDGMPLIESWKISRSDKSRSIRTGPVEVRIEGNELDDLVVSYHVDNEETVEVNRGQQLIVRIDKKKEQPLTARPQEAKMRPETKNVLPGISVLPMVELDRDRISGFWELDESGLTGESFQVSDHSLLELPVDVPDRYRLELGFKRVWGNQSININLPIGDQSVTCVIGGFPDSSGAGYAGLQRLDDLALRDSPEAVALSPLVNRRRYQLVCVVDADKSNASVSVELDSRELFRWSGSIERLFASGIHAGPRSEKLSLSVIESGIQFDSIKLLATPQTRPTAKNNESAPLSQWPKGESDLNELAVSGLVTHPTKLSDGRNWNMIREIGEPPIHDICWSPDGNYLCVASNGDYLQIFEFLDNSRLALVKVLRTEGLPGFHRCRFSPDGRWLAATRMRKDELSQLHIWDTKSWSHAANKELKPDELQWSQTNQWLFARTNNKLWKVDLDGSHKLFCKLPIEWNKVRQLQVAESVGLLFCLDDAGTVSVIDFSGKLIDEVPAHIGDCDLRLSPDQKHIYLEAQSNGYGHRIWDVNRSGLTAAKIGNEIPGLASYATNAGAWAGDSKTLAVAGSEWGSELWIWELRSEGWFIRNKIRLPKWTGPHLAHGTIKWNPQKERLVVSNNHQLVIVDSTNGNVLDFYGTPYRQFSTSRVAVHHEAMLISEPGGQLFTSSVDGKSVAALPDSPLCRFAAKITEEIDAFITSHSVNEIDRQTLQIRESKTGKVLMRESGTFYQPAFQGRWLSYVTKSQQPNEKESYQFISRDPIEADSVSIHFEAPIAGYCWSNDSEILAVADGQQQLTFYLPNGNAMGESIQLPETQVRHMCWDAENKHVLIQTQRYCRSVSLDARQIDWTIELPKNTKVGMWYSTDGDVVRVDGKSIYFHNAANGELKSLKTISFDHRPSSQFLVTPLPDEDLFVTRCKWTCHPSTVIDASTGQILWSFYSGSPRHGKPVLIRWTPAGQVMNPDEAKHHVYYIVEGKDDPEQLEVMDYDRFVKLLPDSPNSN